MAKSLVITSDQPDALDQFDSAIAQIRTAIKSGKRSWKLTVAKDEGKSGYLIELEAEPVKDETPAV